MVLVYERPAAIQDRQRHADRVLRDLRVARYPVADPRRALLLAALGFLRYPPRTSALAALHQWLDNWRGIGLIVVGMERQGYQFSLRKYGNGDGAWVAQFNRDVATSADGFGSGSTPWKATHQAAWRALKRVSYLNFGG